MGGSLAISGSITIGTLASMGVLVAQLYGPLAQLTNARVDVMSAFVSFERVFEVLDAPNPVADSPDAQPLPAGATTGHLAFHDVSFRYPAADEASVASLETDATPDEPGRIVLDGIDLTVGPGQMLAIVGPSGSGKSTMASLVNSLYDLTDG